MEAYTIGVSTRKVEQLGVESMRKSQVSMTCAALDERVEGFRNLHCPRDTWRGNW